ncbi:hypothetical protein D3C80_1703630 [compost metagenome]
MPAFIRKPMELEIVTILFLNKDKGITGLSTLRSISTNITVNKTAPANKPMICEESHSYFVPAHEKPSSREMIAIIKKNEPQ